MKNVDKIPKKFQKKVRDFIEISKRILKDDLISICVFGSVARKQYTQWSDLDFYIVAKKADEQKRFKIMNEFEYSCDVIIRAEKEIPYYLEQLSALELDVFNDGITIFGKDVLREYKEAYENIINKYELVHRVDLGKGVWEIGAAS